MHFAPACAHGGPKTLLKLLQLELSARSPGAPVLKLRIELNPVKPRIQQHGLFIARSPEPAKLEITLSRLCNLLGAGNVGTPELLDTHRPDSFRMGVFRPLRTRWTFPLPIRGADPPAIPPAPDRASAVQEKRPRISQPRFSEAK